MRVYLSGPMTGRPDWNYPAFHAAAADLRALGHTVYNPADSAKDTTTTSRAEFLRDDLALIAGTSGWPPADAIALLPGWTQSAGSRMELHVALALGLQAFMLLESGVVTPCPADQAAVALAVALTRALPKLLRVTEDGEPESAAQEAHRLVHGNRGADYGHPLDDFTRTAGIWTALLGDKLKDGAAIDHGDVWRCMVGVKLSREVNHPKRDNRVDIAGYAETGQMCADEAKRRAA